MNPDPTARRGRVPRAPGRSFYVDQSTCPPNFIAQEKPGTVVSIVANYFRLTPSREKATRINLYHVEMDPEIHSLRHRDEIIRSLDCLKNIQPYVYDGRTGLKCLEQIPGCPRTDLVEYSQGEVKVTMDLASKFGPTDDQMIQLYNSLMRGNFRRMGWSLIRGDFFDPDKTDHYQHDLDIWHGLLTAINRHTNDEILMLCEPTHRILNRRPVLDTLIAIYKNCKGDVQRYQRTARHELSGSVVITRYNNRTYRIHDISFDEGPNSTFMRGDTEISYKDYYKDTYNITIKDFKQPLLISNQNARQIREAEAKGRTPGPFKLVPELCHATGLPKSLATDFKFKRDLAAYLRKSPPQRVQQLIDFSATLRQHSECSHAMEQWNITIPQRPVVLDARKLAGENLRLTDPQGQEMLVPINKGDFTRDVSRAMFRTINWNAWYVIYPQDFEHLVQQFLGHFRTFIQGMQIKVNRPTIIRLVLDRIGEYLQALRDIPPGELVVCILDSGATNVQQKYTEIKKHCYIDIPRPSQVITSRILNKMNPSIVAKIGIQIAAKAGAEPWTVKLPSAQIMVVGFDVWHDTMRIGRSVGAMAASTNSELTKYYSRAEFHEDQSGISERFVSMFEDALINYVEINKQAPKFIIVFRGGIGEGSIPFLFDVELVAMRKRIEKVFSAAETKPFFTFTIVIKRPEARFALMERQKGQDPIFRNVETGTIVDQNVTRINRCEFYLVSQSARQGTAIPTLYNVIFNNSNLKDKDIQGFAYKLTHMYFNWSGTISVPAPCKYAQKLAQMVGEHLHDLPNPHLENSLYYL